MGGRSFLLSSKLLFLYRQTAGHRELAEEKGLPEGVDFEAINRAALPVLPILLARWLPSGTRKIGVSQVVPNSVTRMSISRVSTIRRTRSG